LPSPFGRNYARDSGGLFTGIDDLQSERTQTTQGLVKAIKGRKNLGVVADEKKALVLWGNAAELFKIDISKL
jgi:hypothetical protein